MCEIFCIFGKFCLQLNQVIHDSLLEFDLSLTANDAKKLKEIELILNLTFHHNASLYEKSLFTSDEILEATEWVCVRSYHLYWDSTLKMKFNPICQGKCRQFWLYEHNVFSLGRTIHLRLLIWSPWNIFIWLESLDDFGQYTTLNVTFINLLHMRHDI